MTFCVPAAVKHHHIVKGSKFPPQTLPAASYNGLPSGLHNMVHLQSGYCHKPHISCEKTSLSNSNFPSPNPNHPSPTTHLRPSPIDPTQVSTRACTSRAQRPPHPPPRLLPPPTQHPPSSTPAPPPPAPPVTTMAPPILPTPLPTPPPPPLRSCWETTTAYVWAYLPPSVSTPPGR